MLSKQMLAKIDRAFDLFLLLFVGGLYFIALGFLAQVPALASF